MLSRSTRPVSFVIRKKFSDVAKPSTTFTAVSPVIQKAQFKKRLEEAKVKAELGGGAKRVDTQHKRGKLTARERIQLLLDENSFQEYDKLKTHRCTEFGIDKESYYGDGVITGHGTIYGRKVSMP